MSEKIKTNKELPKTYKPADYEDAIYAQWEKSGFFNPDNLPGEPYSIMMPPPNVTGVLHLGHVLENSLMDIMARYQRMNGKKVLLLPGTDHAAVATQAKVEKFLVEQGLINPRQELGREKLLEKIRAYAENSKSTIIKQIRKMGTSCDWSRLAYTFDERRNRAVNQVFIKMYGDGLIYRGQRAVNWSVKGQSTCSDDELVHIARPAKFYTFKYSKDFPIYISTTRPETKLGDTAVAVNPKDQRYKKYIGQIFTVDVGAAKSLKIKIIADENVEMDFGTGAVGVTPAHSLVDFEMREKQKATHPNASGGREGEPIALIQVIDQQGKMTQAAGEQYVGLSVLEAREKFVAWLKKENLLEKEEDITQNVGTSDRFGDAVEVLPMTQWFVDVNKKILGKDKSLKDLLREAVIIGHNNDPEQRVKITPERFEKIYLNWIDNLRDWCISRQIWWGHRIPVYYRKPEITKSQIPNPKQIQNYKSKISNLTAGKEIYVGIEPPEDEGWIQDEDTLDTWFSSGLWTFSTLGWPEKSPLPLLRQASGHAFVKGGISGKTPLTPLLKGGVDDLKNFHPTSWMQMGYEIIFLWMVRMILMSIYALDQIPFKDVYIHGMLRDQSGKKFSKSSGNNIDPLEIAAKYGMDALRLSLISGIAPGNDSRFYEEKVEGARNMVNKLWNVARYIIANFQFSIFNFQLNAEKLTLADKWILGKLDNLIQEVTENLENYKFAEAGERLRVFTWDDLADWYLEISKFEQGKTEILYFILENLLKLWHPFMPFVTERIWSEMGQENLLMVEKWPNKSPLPPFVKGGISGKSPQPPFIKGGNSEFELVKEIIIAIRNARSKNKIEPARQVKAVIYAGAKQKLVAAQARLIKNLRTGISELEVSVAGEKLTKAIYAAVGKIEIYLLGAVNEAKEKVRLEKEINNLEKIIKAAKHKLANKEFMEKAPVAIVKKEKDKLELWRGELKKLKSR